MLSILKIIIK